MAEMIYLLKNEIIRAIFVQLIIVLLIGLFKYVIDKLGLISVDFNLSGKWVDKHKNNKNEEVIEIVKIKQKKMELKMLIRQYKENSISTFYAKGIVSVKSVTAFYFDANKNSSQTGVMIFDIIDNGSKLEGIYIEVDDIRKPNPKKYSYILERRKFNFKENLQLFKNNNYDKVNNICFHE